MKRCRPVLMIAVGVVAVGVVAVETVFRCMVYDLAGVMAFTRHRHLYCVLYRCEQWAELSLTADNASPYKVPLFRLEVFLQTPSPAG